MTTPAPSDAPTSSDLLTGLSDCDGDVIERICDMLPIVDRLRFERTCRRHRRVSRDMVDRERRAILRCISDADERGASAGVGLEIAVRRAIGSCLDRDDSAVEVRRHRDSTVIIAACGVIEAYLDHRLADDEMTPAVLNIYRTMQHGVEIGTELYRFISRHARDRRGTDTSKPLPTLLTLNWAHRLVDPPLRGGPDARSAIDSEGFGPAPMPLIDVCLIGHCHLAGTIEEYLSLIPALSTCVISPETQRRVIDELVRKPDATMSRLRDLEARSSHISPTSIRLAIIYPLALRIAASEGMSVALIELVDAPEKLIPLLTVRPRDDPDGWWSTSSGLGILSAFIDAMTRASPVALPMIMDGFRQLLAVRYAFTAADLVSELGSRIVRLLDNRAAVSTLVPMRAFASREIWLGCISLHVGATVNYLAMTVEMLDMLFRQSPSDASAAFGAPIASRHDGLALLRVNKLHGSAMHVFTQLDLIPFDELASARPDAASNGSTSVLTLASDCGWKPSAVVVLCGHLRAGSVATPDYSDLLRYLIAKRTLLAGALREYSARFLSSLITAIASAAGIEYLVVPLEEAWHVLAAFETKYSPIWRFER